MLRLAFALSCLVAAPRAEVLVLDAAGGGDFQTLAQVASGAADGDVILVRPGSYPGPSDSFGVTFAGKSLALVADGTGPVDTTAIRVLDLPAGKTFLLRGLRLVLPGQSTGPHTRLQVNISQGAVLVEDCVIAGQGDQSLFEPSRAVGVVASSLSLVRCTITGGSGVDTFAGQSGGLIPGNLALVANQAHVLLSRCQITGGAGGDDLVGAPTSAGPGSAAITSTQSEIWVSGCELTGGAGGVENGVPTLSGPPVGGPAVLADALSVVHLRDSTLAGGAGGTSALGTGATGPLLDGPSEVLAPLPGPARTLQIDAPLAEGAHGTLQVHGQPGELALLLPSFKGDWAALPKFGGVRVVGPAAGPPILLGPLDASGALQLELVAPHVGLGPGESLGLLAQLLTVQDSTLVLGDASSFLEVP
jgi:hypothetical protein